MNNLHDLAPRLVLALSRGMSQRRAANDVGVARGTLLDWKDRTEKIPLSKKTVDFFESPDGAIFIDRLVNALQFVMNQVGSCGIRLISMVLRLSYLDYFVSSSYERSEIRCIDGYS